MINSIVFSFYYFHRFVQSIFITSERNPRLLASISIFNSLKVAPDFLLVKSWTDWKINNSYIHEKGWDTGETTASKIGEMYK